MASPGNQHCANCIGTLSFTIGCRSIVTVYEYARVGLRRRFGLFPS